jgi:dTDP-4-amino-4,6-dideoxygalactose transaminase
MNKIRLSKSSLGVEEKQAVLSILDSEFLGMGAETANFENDLKAYIGGEREIISVNTGTSALNLALSCLNVGAGDEVIVPSLTYVASYQAIAACGAIPVSCDVNINTGFICPKAAEKLITKHTKVIMPVHYASQSYGIKAIYALAQRYNLRVVEDAAHAFGCIYDGKKVGSFGDIICFSFDGIKNITCGEGGAIVTGDLHLADRLRDARLLGVEKDSEARFKGQRSWTFDVKHLGYRYHLSNIMAAIGREQLKKIDTFGKRRRNCVLTYMTSLEAIPEVTLFHYNYDGVIPHIFPIRVKKSYRHLLREFLLSRDIETGLHYYPNHKLTLFRTSTDNCPNTESIADELITLPLHADLGETEVAQVVDSIRLFFDGIEIKNA